MSNPAGVISSNLTYNKGINVIDYLVEIASELRCRIATKEHHNTLYNQIQELGTKIELSNRYPPYPPNVAKWEEIQKHEEPLLVQWDRLKNIKTARFVLDSCLFDDVLSQEPKLAQLSQKASSHLSATNHQELYDLIAEYDDFLKKIMAKFSQWDSVISVLEQQHQPE